MTDTPFSDAQLRMVDFAMERKGSAWFAPPGLGKTRSWMETIKETGERTLVVAPKLVCMDTWPRENKKWGYDFTMRFLHGREKHFRGKEMVSLINPEAMPWAAEKLCEQRVAPYKYVIFDELSKWKTPSSQRVQSWLKLQPKIEFKSGGTGTPVGAHLKDLFGEMLTVDGGKSLGSDYERFISTYFHTDPYTREVTPYSDAEAEIMERIRPRAISFDINDLDMPPLRHIPHYLDLPTDVRAIYQEMHDNNVVDELDLYAANAAVKSGKLRQMVGGGVKDMNGAVRYLHDAKAERLAQILDDMDGRPVMVFFEFYSDYESICRIAKREVPALYGKTKSRDAARIIKQWNAGKIPLLAMHPRSAAWGVNLQDSGNIVIFYTVPWSVEMIIQGIGRIWRQGQKNKVLAYYLLVENSEDERVYARITSRKEVHERVMEALL
jgi:hypothetical protein